MSKSFIYELAKPLELTIKGDFQEVASFELRAPTMAEFIPASKFMQLIGNAFFGAQEKMGAAVDEETKQDAVQDLKEKKAAGEDDNIDPASIRLMLFSSEVDISKIDKAFRRLVVKVGTYDGETPIKDAALNKMDMEDYLDLMCAYVSNFTYPSLFSEARDASKTKTDE